MARYGETKNMNWVALVIIVMWISASVATAFTGNSGCLGMAAFTTICMGFGYILLHD